MSGGRLGALFYACALTGPPSLQAPQTSRRDHKQVSRKGRLQADKGGQTPKLPSWHIPSSRSHGPPPGKTLFMTGPTKDRVLPFVSLQQSRDGQTFQKSALFLEEAQRREQPAVTCVSLVRTPRGKLEQDSFQTRALGDQRREPGCQPVAQGVARVASLPACKEPQGHLPPSQRQPSPLSQGLRGAQLPLGRSEGAASRGSGLAVSK